MANTAEKSPITEGMHFRSALLQISKQLTEAEVDQMKFLIAGLPNKPGFAEVENVKTGMGLFMMLMKSGDISEENYYLLGFLLDQVGQKALVKRFKELLQTGSTSSIGNTSRNTPPPSPNDTQDGTSLRSPHPADIQQSQLTTTHGHNPPQRQAVPTPNAATPPMSKQMSTPPTHNVRLDEPQVPPSTNPPQRQVVPAPNAATPPVSKQMSTPPSRNTSARPNECQVPPSAKSQTSPRRLNQSNLPPGARSKRPGQNSATGVPGGLMSTPNSRLGGSPRADSSPSQDGLQSSSHGSRRLQLSHTSGTTGGVSTQRSNQADKPAHVSQVLHNTKSPNFIHETPKGAKQIRTTPHVQPSYQMMSAAPKMSDNHQIPEDQQRRKLDYSERSPHGKPQLQQTQVPPLQQGQVTAANMQSPKVPGLNGSPVVGVKMAQSQSKPETAPGGTPATVPSAMIHPAQKDKDQQQRSYPRTSAASNAMIHPAQKATHQQQGANPGTPVAPSAMMYPAQKATHQQQGANPGTPVAPSAMMYPAQKATHQQQGANPGTPVAPSAMMYPAQKATHQQQGANPGTPVAPSAMMYPAQKAIDQQQGSHPGSFGYRTLRSVEVPLTGRPRSVLDGMPQPAPNDMGPPIQPPSDSLSNPSAGHDNGKLQSRKDISQNAPGHAPLVKANSSKQNLPFPDRNSTGDDGMVTGGLKDHGKDQREQISSDSTSQHAGNDQAQKVDRNLEVQFKTLNLGSQAESQRGPDTSDCKQLTSSAADLETDAPDDEISVVSMRNDKEGISVVGNQSLSSLQSIWSSSPSPQGTLGQQRNYPTPPGLNAVIKPTTTSGLEYSGVIQEHSSLPSSSLFPVDPKAGDKDVFSVFAPKPSSPSRSPVGSSGMYGQTSPSNSNAGDLPPGAPGMVQGYQHGRPWPSHTPSVAPYSSNPYPASPTAVHSGISTHHHPTTVLTSSWTSASQSEQSLPPGMMGHTAGTGLGSSSRNPSMKSPEMQRSSSEYASFQREPLPLEMTYNRSASDNVVSYSGQRSPNPDESGYQSPPQQVQYQHPQQIVQQHNLLPGTNASAYHQTSLTTGLEPGTSDVSPEQVIMGYKSPGPNEVPSFYPNNPSSHVPVKPWKPGYGGARRTDVDDVALVLPKPPQMMDASHSSNAYTQRNESPNPRRSSSSMLEDIKRRTADSIAQQGQKSTKTKSVSNIYQEREENLMNFEKKTLRKYQDELAAPAKTGDNYIICAPTGSGKTLTAASICLHLYEEAKAKGMEFKSLFIVNIRHLTQQQTMAFNETFPVGTVGTIGETDQLRAVFFEPDHAVVMVTAQILLNALRKTPTPDLNLQDISLIIFDECHHTTQDHPYNEIMKRYLREKKLKLNMRREIGKSGPYLPQIIGLSASLGVGHGKDAFRHILTLCSNMDAKNVIQVHKHIHELEMHVNSPDQDVILYCLPRHVEKRHLGDIIDGIMTQIELQLWTETLQHGTQIYEQWVVDSRQKAEVESDQNCILACLYLFEYNRALLLYEDLRAVDAFIHLENFMKNRYVGHHLEPMEELCRELFRSEREDMKRISNEEVDSHNPKLLKLATLLKQKFMEKPHSKGIVLTRMRLGTMALENFIKQTQILQGLPCRVRPIRLVGQGETDNFFMTEPQQKQALELFRKDDSCNLLVATDIAQEGLDMPACNFVIRYNFVSNEIGTVQSKGRARAEQSECFLIVEQGSQNASRELGNRQKVENMKEAMLKLNQLTEEERFLEITKRQEEIYKEMESKDTMTKIKHGIHQPEAVQILCKECNMHITQGHYMRKKGCHFTCMDPDIKQKVHIVKFRKPQVYRDTHNIGNFKCGNPKCGQQLGVAILFLDGEEITHRGYGFKVQSFLFKLPDDSKKTFKQWKKVTFDIPEMEC